jgi:16S rRNA (adenine1518-N6/adenine1519-N6)-dimethyltransferase
VLVHFVRHQHSIATEAERVVTFALADAAFGQRRKMLRQSLAQYLGTETNSTLARADVDGTWRAEQLSVNDFLRLAQAVLS